MILFVYITYQILALSRSGQAISTVPIEPLISAAAGNRTTLNTQISTLWALKPGVRGTSDILWSCLLTLISCVYTAIHLNVPPAGEGKWQSLGRQLKWVVIALFAPEVILYCALNQFLEARKLVNELNKLWATQQPSDIHMERKAPLRKPSRTSLSGVLNPATWTSRKVSIGRDLEKDMVGIWNR